VGIGTGGRLSLCEIARLEGDQEFESGFLQRGVSSEPYGNPSRCPRRPDRARNRGSGLAYGGLDLTPMQGIEILRSWRGGTPRSRGACGTATRIGRSPNSRQRLREPSTPTLMSLPRIAPARSSGQGQVVAGGYRTVAQRRHRRAISGLVRMVHRAGPRSSRHQADLGPQNLLAVMPGLQPIRPRDGTSRWRGYQEVGLK
jgi:hypothetical protein